MEFISGESWKLESNHIPLDGYVGPDSWPTDQALEDHYLFLVPANTAPGEYRVRVKMMRQPHYPNARLREYLVDLDSGDGEVVGTVIIGETLR